MSDKPNYILVVEDSQTQAAQLTYLLQEHGYTVSLAADGYEALGLLHQHPSRLVLSDILMPQMDGYTLCQAIKEDATLAHIPVVLLTSLADPYDIIRGLECGVDGFIVKPYDAEYLLARIAYLLTSQTLRISGEMQLSMEIDFSGKRHVINAEKTQILTLLITTFEEAVRQNRQLLQVQQELRALNEQLEARVQERTTNLQASEAKYRALLEVCVDALCVVNAEGAICFGNPASADLFGCTVPELLGKTFPFSVQVGAIQEVVSPRYGDDPIVAEMRAVDIAWEGEPAYLVLLRDITERKRAEESLKQRDEQLRQAQKMEAVGRLAGGIAHEFNNMLTVISGYSDLTLMHLDHHDKLRRNIERIHRVADRAALLIRQMLTFSRQEISQPQILDCNSVVVEMEKLMRPLIGENIELVCNLAPQLWQVQADPLQLQQLLMHLGVNACDAMPQGGTLTLETANIMLQEGHPGLHAGVPGGPYVMLTVDDTGVGMDAETLTYLFEPFFTTKAPGKGTGLGLAMVYGIVQQHGGGIEVQSARDQGTTFKVYLPRVGKALPAAATLDVTTAHSVPISGTETILLVEDEPIIRELIQNLLETEGYRVLQASNAEEAIRLCEQCDTRIHLLVTDVVMPGMSGFELARRFRSSFPDLRILLISGYPSAVIEHDGVVDTPGAFLSKPFRPEVLLAKVREVLEVSTD
jgi:signal transduction histidine kinase/DNA-binding response OmpR family regulator